MVQFGARLEAVRVKDWAGQYLAYQELKPIIKKAAAASGGLAKDDCGVEFMEYLEAEIGKIGDFAVAKFTELRNSGSLLLRELVRRSETPKHGSKQKIAAKASPLTDLEGRVETLGRTLVNLDRFLRINQEGLRKIAKKYDKVVADGSQMQRWVLTRLRMQKFMKLETSQLLVPLSTCYSILRRLRAGAKGGDADKLWQPPESFQRKTTKYWVRMEDLMELKVKIIQQLPVLLFGESPEAKIKRVATGDAAAIAEVNSLTTSFQDNAPITSLYLDSPDLKFYEGRIKRDEGAKLVRVRWYGAKPPKADGKVFMERKTHHESWVREDSMKERFDIANKHVRSFFDGKFDPHAHFENLVHNESMTLEKARAQWTLAAETQALVQKIGAKSLVRTTYKRTAFQLPTSNDVRISIDTDLVLANEESAFDEPGRWYLKANNESRDAVDIPMIETDQDQSLHLLLQGDRGKKTGGMNSYKKARFPYAILEVKLQGDAPEWIQAIEAMPYLTKVGKFSKFLTGCAMLYPDRIKNLPHWFEPDGSIANILPEHAAASLDLKSVIVDCDDWLDTKTGEPSRVNEKTERPHRSIVVPVRMTSKDKEKQGTAKLTPAPNRYVPVRVEPKTFFANERTFIQWLGAAILLLTLSSAMIAFDDTAAVAVAYAFLMIGMLFLIYALVMFHCRAEKIRAKSDGPYDDRFGPTAIVVALLVAGVMSAIYTFDPASAIAYLTSPDQGLVETGKCRLVQTRHCSGMSSVNGIVFNQMDANENQLITTAFASLCKSTASATKPFSFAAPEAVHASATVGANIIGAAIFGKDANTTYIALVNGTANADNAWLFSLPFGISVSVPVPMMVPSGGFVNVANPVTAITTLDPATPGAKPTLFAATAQGIAVGRIESGTVSLEHVLPPYIFGTTVLDVVDMATSAKSLFVMTAAKGTIPAKVHVVEGADTGEYIVSASHNVLGESNPHWIGLGYDPANSKMYLANEFPPNVWEVEWDNAQGFSRC